MAENPMLHANFIVLRFIELESWSSEFCGNRDFFKPFLLFALDTMIFIYEPDLCCLKIHRMCKYELPTSRDQRVTEITYSRGVAKCP